MLKLGNKKKKKNGNNNKNRQNNQNNQQKKSAENIIDINEEELHDIFSFEPADAEPEAEVNQEAEAPAEKTAEVSDNSEKKESVPAESKAETPAEAAEEKAPAENMNIEKPTSEPKPEAEKPAAEEEPAKQEPVSTAPAAEPNAEAAEPAREKPAAEISDPVTEMNSEQLDALDKLDRDLAKAQHKKEKEQQRAEAKRAEEQKIEQERIEKAKQAQERANKAAERAAEIEKEKQLAAAKPAQTGGEKSASKSASKPVKERDPELGMNIIKGVTVLVVVAGIAYAGGLVYAKNLNDTFIESMEKELMGIASAGANEENDTHITDGKLSDEEKEALGLAKYLPDTDKDGLSDYYEINVSKTDPKNEDTDGDGITDGAEVYAGYDPLTANDANAVITNVISSEGASVEISGKAQNAVASIDEVTNNSIRGAAGVVGTPYEFYTTASMESCKLTINYSTDDLNKWNSLPTNLAIFKFNPETLNFDKVEGSRVDANAGTVSADIDSIGIYAIGDDKYMQETYNTRIFFLIDNSGSMYPEEMCPNSEENDVEFKRLDFASNLIDRLGTNAQYGAAKFTGTYTKISDITDNTSSVKNAIDGIRTDDTYFDGTEIADSISNAVDELGKNRSDKNYIVLLTDGYPSSPNAEKEAAALQKAVDNNITIFTIGLGKRIDAEYLTNIADATNGQFFQVSNASALDSICDKIESFMSYNKTTISLEEETDVYILADSGFNVTKDSMAYSNFRTDFSETGTDYGIAELTREYYTGELALSSDGYKTDDGREITGYDLHSVEQLVDGKPDLVDLDIGFLDTYNDYLALDDKWNYKTSKDGLLKYTPDALNFIATHNMTTITQPYTIELPELDSWIQMLQNITFQKLPEFTSYECAVINSKIPNGSDSDMIDAFEYMQYIHNSSEKCDIYDFGFNGSEAFDILSEELTKGNPVVISMDGSALNAVRLLRESENTNKFVLEAYDCNNMGTTSYIKLLRSPIYDGEKTPYYQYSATLNGKEMSLKMYITK